jgi:SAM-dependent methyltransferase
VTFDPEQLAKHDLRPLRELLLDAGYRTETLAKQLKLHPKMLLADTARNSLIHGDSLGSSPSAVLGRLFLLCAPVPVPEVRKLSNSLIQTLYGYDLVRADAAGRHVVGNVTITEVDGFYYVADRLFENTSGAVGVTISSDVCMPPHASSFELAKAISVVSPDSSVLDVGCGSGCLSLPLTASAGLVTGIDTSSRAVAFSRANASCNGVTARFEHVGWEKFDSPEQYDLILYNSPDERAAFDFVNNGLPRLLRHGGRAQVRLVCDIHAEDRDVQGAVSRMTSVGPQFDVRILAPDDSLFSLSRDVLARGGRPARTLLVERHSEWHAYVDSLRRRGVVEVASIILDITRGRPGFSGQ